MPSPGNFTANDTVHTSRIVTTQGQGTAQGVASVVECTDSTTRPIGISFEGGCDTPGLTGSDVTIAARVGEPIRVYQNGDVCWVLVDPNGLALVAGSRVKCVGSAGQAGPFVGGEQSGVWSIGTCIKDAEPGNLAQVLIDIQPNAIPQS